MKFILDAESVETVLSSLSKGFECDLQSLTFFLRSIPIESFDKFSGVSDFAEYVFWMCCDHFGCHPIMRGFYVFHLTRTNKDNFFEEGLLPLNSAKKYLLPLVEKSIPIHAKEDFFKMKESFLSSCLKSEASEQGPCGFLIKEEALFQSNIKYNFLDMPEIVKDGCDAFRAKFEYDIENFISNYLNENLVPKVVKFYALNKGDYDDFFMKYLMYYVWIRLNGFPVDYKRNCDFFTFSNMGEVVDKIIYVENVDLEFKK